MAAHAWAWLPCPSVHRLCPQAGRHRHERSHERGLLVLITRFHVQWRQTDLWSYTHEIQVQQWLSPSTFDSTSSTGHVTRKGENSNWASRMLRQWQLAGSQQGSGPAALPVVSTNRNGGCPYGLTVQDSSLMLFKFEREPQQIACLSPTTAAGSFTRAFAPVWARRLTTALTLRPGVFVPVVSPVSQARTDWSPGRGQKPTRQWPEVSDFVARFCDTNHIPRATA